MKNYYIPSFQQFINENKGSSTIEDIKDMAKRIMNSRRSDIIEEYREYLKNALKQNKASKIEDFNETQIKSFLDGFKETLDYYQGYYTFEEYAARIKYIEQLGKAIKDSGKQEAIREFVKLVNIYLEKRDRLTIQDINNEKYPETITKKLDSISGSETVEDIIADLDASDMDEDEGIFQKYGIKMPKPTFED